MRRQRIELEEKSASVTDVVNLFSIVAHCVILYFCSDRKQCVVNSVVNGVCLPKSGNTILVVVNSVVL